MPFRSGRYERFWVKNVVGVGNSVAFVEPLEATALAFICLQCQAVAEVLHDCSCLPNRSTIGNFNRQLARGYDAVRDEERREGAEQIIARGGNGDDAMNQPRHCEELLRRRPYVLLPRGDSPPFARCEGCPD